MKKQFKSRLVYALLFVALTAVEVVIALFVNDRFLRPYGGDIIVMGVLFCFVRAFILNKLKALPLWLFLFAALVEAGQYFNYAALLGLDKYEFFRILLGSSFSWYDIACYAAGSLICLAAEATVNILKASKSLKSSYNGRYNSQ